MDEKSQIPRTWKSLGSATVSSLIPVKFFDFCRKSFPKLSKTAIRSLFVAGSVSVNGKRITCGHSEESRKLNPGTCVELFLDPTTPEKRVSIPTVFMHNNCIGMVFKEPGISCSESSLFDNAARKNIFFPIPSSTAIFLYRLEKSLQGICIVSSSADQHRKLRSLLFRNEISLTYRCIVCGKIAEKGDIREFENVYNKQIKFQVQVTDVLRCRSTEYLSAVNIEPRFYDPNVQLDPASQAYDLEVQRFINNGIRGIKRTLFLSGYPIVGDHKMVKCAKGLYASLFAVTMRADPSLVELDDSKSSCKDCNICPTVSYPRTISIPEPVKFNMLLMRESRLWSDAAKRDENWAYQLGLADSIRTRGDESLYYDDGRLVDNKCSDQSDDGVVENGDGAVAGTCSLEEDNLLPMEYRLGCAIFCGLKLTVNKYVMIPRRSSECVVRTAVKLLTESLHWKEVIIRGAEEVAGSGPGTGLSVAEPSLMQQQQQEEEATQSRAAAISNSAGIRVLDLGTGSGCLLLSCMHALIALSCQADPKPVWPDPCKGSSEDTASVAAESSRLASPCRMISGVGVDICPAAIQTAERNAAQLDLNNCTAFVTASFADLTCLLPTYSIHQDNEQSTFKHSHVASPWLATACKCGYSGGRSNGEGSCVYCQPGNQFGPEGEASDDATVTAAMRPPMRSGGAFGVPLILHEGGSGSVLKYECINQGGPESTGSGPPAAALPGAATDAGQTNSQSQHPVYKTERGPFNLIICNPPYSSYKERNRLSLRHRMHEPAVAIFADCVTDRSVNSISRQQQGVLINSSVVNTAAAAAAPLPPDNPRVVTVEKEGARFSGPLAAFETLANSLSNVLLCEGRNEAVGSTSASQWCVSRDSFRPEERELPSGVREGHYCGKEAGRDPATMQSGGATGHRSADRSLLLPGGHLVLEVGHGQADEVISIFRDTCAQLTFVQSVQDHKGIVRCLVFKYGEA